VSSLSKRKHFLSWTTIQFAENAILSIKWTQQANAANAVGQFWTQWYILKEKK